MRSRTGIIIALVSAAIAASVIVWLVLGNRSSGPDVAGLTTTDATAPPADAAPAVPEPVLRLIPQGIEGFADLPSDVITAVAVAGGRSEPIWFVGTDAGLAISRDRGQTVQRPARLGGAIHAEITDIAFAGDALYLATRAGLYQAVDAIAKAAP